MTKCLFCLFLLVWVASQTTLRAMESGKILAVSPTGKTVTINYGEGDGLRMGDVVKIFLRPGYLEKEARYIGEGHGVKVFLNHSLWRIDYINEGLKLTLGDEVILFKVSDYKQFKGKLQIDRKRYVLSHRSEFNLSELWDYEQREQPQELIKRSALFDPTINPWQAKKDIPYLLRLRDLSQWKTTADGQNLYIKNLMTVPPTEVLVDRRFENDFDYLVHGYFQMIGDPAVNLRNYKRQEKDEQSQLINEKISLNNTFEDYEARQIEVAREKERHQRWAKIEGQEWSERMDDGELYRYVEDHGLRMEEDRQSLAQDVSVDHEIRFIYARPVSDTKRIKSEEVLSTTEMRLGYELYGVRVWDNWRTISSTFWLGRDNNKTKTEGGDALLRNSYLAVDIQYYLWNEPPMLYRPLFYIGMGFAYGGGVMKESDGGTAFSNYDTKMMPGFLVGLKWRWSQFIGFGVGYKFEHWVYNCSDNKPEKGFAGHVTQNLSKVFLGLSGYF